MEKVCRPVVSIVIPVYNVEQYLPLCLESVIRQTLRNIQIICVNDGSTDGSLGCLQRYANRDSRIIVLDKPNGGVSSARNFAMTYVTGQYVKFVDADDYISDNACEMFVACAKDTDADIVISNVYRVSDSKIVGLFEKRQERVYDLDRLNDLRDACFEIGYVGTPAVFFSSRVIEGLQYESLTNGEDSVFYARAFCRSTRIAILRHALYFYVVRENSASQAISSGMLRSHVDAIARVFWVLSSSSKIRLIRDVVSRLGLRSARIEFTLITENQRFLSRQEMNALWRHWRACYVPVLKDAGKYNFRIRLFAWILILFPSFRLCKCLTQMSFSAVQMLKMLSERQ